MNVYGAREILDCFGGETGILGALFWKLCFVFVLDSKLTLLKVPMILPCCLLVGICLCNPLGLGYLVLRGCLWIIFVPVEFFQ
jgi:hypothetical protein